MPTHMYMRKPLGDLSFHAMGACKPKRRVFPLEGNHMEKGSFQDGNPMELVVNLWFPCGFPYFSPEGKSNFSPSDREQNIAQLLNVRQKV